MTPIVIFSPDGSSAWLNLDQVAAIVSDGKGCWVHTAASADPVWLKAPYADVVLQIAKVTGGGTTK